MLTWAPDTVQPSPSPPGGRSGSIKRENYHHPVKDPSLHRILHSLTDTHNFPMKWAILRNNASTPRHSRRGENDFAEVWTNTSRKQRTLFTKKVLGIISTVKKGHSCADSTRYGLLPSRKFITCVYLMRQASSWVFWTMSHFLCDILIRATNGSVRRARLYRTFA